MGTERRTGPRWRRPWVAAAAASLGLHVAALVWLRGGAEVPRAVPEARPVQIEVRVAVPVAPVAGESDEEHDRQAPDRARTPAARAPVRAAAKSRDRPVESAPVTPPARGAAVARGEPAAGGGEPREAPLMRMRPRSAADLSLSTSGAAVALGAGPDAPPPAVGEGVRLDAAGRVLHGPRRRTVEEFAAEQGALAAERENREKGLAHPQLYDYARDARAVFRPDVAFMESIAGEPGYVDTMVDQYRNADEKKATKHFNALVCVTITPGTDPVFAVRTSSKNARFDALAVDSLKRAVDRRAVDEPLLPGGPLPRDSLVRACYSFDATLQRVPPNLGTLIGGSFEETTGEVGLVYWFKKIMNLAVHLETVGYKRP